MRVGMCPTLTDCPTFLLGRCYKGFFTACIMRNVQRGLPTTSPCTSVSFRPWLSVIANRCLELLVELPDGRFFHGSDRLCTYRCGRTLGARLSSRLICRFLRLGSHHWFQRCKMCPAFYKNSSSSRQTAPVPCERDRSCFLRHFMERARNAAICARVQVALGSNFPLPTPVVMPFSMAHATACA